MWQPHGQECELDLIYPDEDLQDLLKIKKERTDATLTEFVEGSSFFKSCCEKNEYNVVLGPSNDHAREVILEWHTRYLAFADALCLTPKQTNIFTSLMALILYATARWRSRECDFPGELFLQTETFILFRDYLIRFFREGHFSMEDCKRITDFVNLTFFLQYKLYQYSLALAVDLEKIEASTMYRSPAMVMEFFAPEHILPTLVSFVKTEVVSEEPVEEVDADGNPRASVRAAPKETSLTEKGTEPLANRGQELLIQEKVGDLAGRVDRKLDYIKQQKELERKQKERRKRKF